MKQLIVATVLLLGVSGMTGSALAHGAKPQYGGVVTTASDLQFELVDKNGTAAIFVEDHGKKLTTAGMSGKITVLNGTEKTELPLKPMGENQLEAQGKAVLGKGAKAIATISMPDKKVVNVRFAVK